MTARRLAIGTAQFGLSYGVSNRGGQVSPAMAHQILARAAQLGIDLIDTAIAYGNGEQVLGDVGVAGFNVVSKLPPLPTGIDDVEGWIDMSVENSMARLKVDRLYALLLHRSEMLTGASGEATRRAFRRLKQTGKVFKTGVSIYGPEELEALGSTDDLDLVQTPLNILDTRIIDSGWLSRLQTGGVEVHVRSVFLQGLLLMNAQERPAHFRQWDSIWTSWDGWLAESGMTPLEACLRFALSVEAVDRFVVGVESLSHLEEIAAAAARRGIADRPLWRDVPPMGLLNPSLWKI